MITLCENNQTGKTIPEDLHVVKGLTGATEKYQTLGNSECYQPDKHSMWMKLLWESLESGQ